MLIFVLYNNINEFNNFINNNKIGVYNVLTMKNDISLKDITIKNEDLLKIGYDDDLKIIYNYLTLPVIKRTSKKSKIYQSTTIENDNINSIDDNNNNEDNDNNNDEDNKDNDDNEDNFIPNINNNIDLSTEQAVENVILESYDEKQLNKLKVVELQELLKKQNISLYINGKKKTKQQMINELK